LGSFRRPRRPSRCEAVAAEIELVGGCFSRPLDVQSGRLDYVCAGHIPPWLRRASASLERLDGPGGPPLGLVEDMTYREGTVVLGAGDRLLAVTDGVTEAADPSDAMFGEARSRGLTNNVIISSTSIMRHSGFCANWSKPQPGPKEGPAGLHHVLRQSSASDALRSSPAVASRMHSVTKSPYSSTDRR
jgi:Stage II sporulation protein E (SpoIIE)